MATKGYEARADIAAPPEAIWPILTDTGAWADWDSGVVSVEGRVEPGAKLKVTLSANPGRAYPIRVTELVPDRRMVWTGGMPLGLFKGVRTYTLEPNGAGTAFTVHEAFAGPLVPLIWRSMPDLGPSFEQFARGLKQRAER